MDFFFSVFLRVVNTLRVPTFSLLRLLLFRILAETPYQFGVPNQLQSTYDFVVVGGGTAGSVIAARLAESGASVLLMEAGGSAPPETAVPLLFPLYIGGDADWNIRLASQESSQWGFMNNASNLALGKVMGGSSSIGNLVYGRGNKHDYNNWDRLGNQGWDYESVLPYFKKSEDYTGERSLFTDVYHGRNGPLRVDSKRFATRVGSSLLQAGRELGYDIIDENSEDSIGFSPMHFVIRNGVRETTSESFIRPLRSLSGLHVLTGATVTKIVFEGKKAVGVEYTSHNRRTGVRATNEVILCAGVINSPKLLMLSGVGPESHLRSMGIPVVSPVEGVGRNLQDHHVIFHFPYAVNDGSAFSVANDLSVNSLKLYIRQQKGPLSQPFGEDGSAWVNLSGDDSQWPDVQISMFNLAFSVMGELAVALSLSLKKEVYRDILEPLQGGEAILLAPVLLRPKSRGRVMLKSNDPQDDPIVDFNFLSHPDDVKLMIKAIRFSQSIAKTRAMQGRVEPTYKSKPLSACAHLPDDSDSYWECHARHLVTTFYHPAGSCKMAPDTDPEGVVSPTLKVRGVEGLRLADASVMPQINGANTMAAVIMIAERAADLIKQDWGYPVTLP